jgi:hypothetical protein
VILVNIMVKKKPKTPPKKPQGRPRMLRLPPELDDWLVEHTKQKGAASIQETVRQILTAARASEQQQEQAA